MQQRLILYMEDDADEVEIMKDAFEIIAPSCRLLHAPDGEQGLQKLSELKALRQLPCLVVLDINMPKINGKEAVLELKKDHFYSHLPIVVLSNSHSRLDELFFSKYNVAMLSKPTSFTDYLNVAHQLLKLCR